MIFHPRVSCNNIPNYKCDYCNVTSVATGNCKCMLEYFIVESLGSFDGLDKWLRHWIGKYYKYMCSVGLKHI